MIKALLSAAAQKTAEEYTVKPKTSKEMYGGGLEPCGPNDSKKKYYPSISLDSDALPEIRDWEVGSDYYILMKVTQKSLNINDSAEFKRADARFDIKEIAVIDQEDESADDKSDD